MIVAKLLRQLALFLTVGLLPATLADGQQARSRGSVAGSSQRISQARQPAATTKAVGASAAAGRDPAAIFAGGAPTTVAELKAMQAVTQRLSEQVMQSTVGVRVGPAQGSGVIVTKEGHVLTAAHVAGAPGRDVTFILEDGRMVRGKTLGVFYDLDAGLLQITEGGTWQPASVGDSNKIKVGQWCLGTGHPGGYEQGRNAVVRLGRVLRMEDDGITTDCTLVGGDSGGPLFDMQGRVIGIHSRIGNSLTTNVHVPVSAYRDHWDRLVRGEAWGSQSGIEPFIGVVGANNSKDARIAHVNPGSPAEEAGIQPGDVITKFAGRPLTDFENLSRAVRAREPGERVMVEIRRDGRTLRLEVTIGGRED
ncbi:MAG: trypsin-like peptidase domain-containing protein [Pirellulales bacterium]